MRHELGVHFTAGVTTLQLSTKILIKR